MNLNHGSDLMSDRIWRSRFFSCFSCQLSISNKELSNDLSYAAGHPTGCMIELTAGGLDSGGAAAALLANILCHQSWEHRTRGPQVAWRASRPSLLSELCQKHNSLASPGTTSALYPAHYTLYSTIDNIGSMLRNMRGWENRKKSLPALSRSICDDNIWRVTSRGRGRGRREM